MNSKQLTKISIIIPSYNRAHYLTGALETLTGLETDDRITYEVVIVDNASTDNTREVVETLAADCDVPVRYLHESKPGDAPPRNKGIRETDGEWLAFFDDDQFAEPRWLLNLLDVAEQQQTRIVGGAVHLDLDDAVTAQLSPACRNTLRELRPYTSDRPYEPHIVPGTGNLLVARSLFDAVGLFSEVITEGSSDMKLVNDVRDRGETPWYAAAAVIRHRVEGNRMTPAYFCWDARNGGFSQAEFDFEKHGVSGLLLRCAARLARATLHLPRHLTATVHPPKHGCSQSSMIWWRTEGFLRRSLTLLAPTMCPQKSFHEYVKFRSGRVVGS